MTSSISTRIAAGATALVVAGFALPAFAQTATSTGAQHADAGKHAKTTAPMNLPCVQTAVDARESAIGQAFSTFSTTESVALAARASALHDAWGQTDASARKSARDAAWSAFKTANKSAYAALRTAKQSAWSTFKTASKSCNAPVVESPAVEGLGSLGL